ncbi:MAG: RecA domain protein [Candidatus Solibacter sp.]|jgi:recombination protein RecA|nr:RecA domain protein [Candidatus Solibacter sp.]
MTEEERQHAIWMKLARMVPPTPPRDHSIATGFHALDEALGAGLPRSAMVELYGPSGCGKTTLAIQVTAHLQHNGLTCAWIDADRTFDSAYAESLGAEVDRIPFAQPDCAEDAFEIVRTLAGSGAVDLVIVDSAAALVPQLELAAGISYYSKGLHSRVLSSGLRNLRRTLANSGACVVFLNQVRNRPAGGSGETSAGGVPLKLFAAVRIALIPVEGPRLCLRVLKNKLAEQVSGRELAWIRGSGFVESP